MYGLNYNFKASDEKIQQLDIVRQESRKIDMITNQHEQFTAKITTLETRLAQIEEGQKQTDEKMNDIESRLGDMERLIFGDRNGELYDDHPEVARGLINDIRHQFEKQREEYVDLISGYVQNSTPRTDKLKMEELEKRLKLIEERPQPKFQVTQTPLTRENVAKLPFSPKEAPKDTKRT